MTYLRTLQKAKRTIQILIRNICSGPQSPNMLGSRESLRLPRTLADPTCWAGIKMLYHSGKKKVSLWKEKSITLERIQYHSGKNPVDDWKEYIMSGTEYILSGTEYWIKLERILIMVSNKISFSSIYQILLLQLPSVSVQLSSGRG